MLLRLGPRFRGNECVREDALSARCKSVREPVAGSVVEGESRTQGRRTWSHRSTCFGGQGVHRAAESYGYAEKYRAVIDWGRPRMNRSAKDGIRSSPHYGGEGVTHSPIVPRCLLTARYGRFMRDPRRPVGVLVFDRVSDLIIGSEMGSDAQARVGERNSTVKRETNNSRDRRRRTGSGSGKDPEERGQRYETPRGTPQWGVASPLPSNILLTPFDKEKRQKGYLLTRWADDWVVTCHPHLVLDPG